MLSNVSTYVIHDSHMMHDHEIVLQTMCDIPVTMMERGFLTVHDALQQTMIYRTHILHESLFVLLRHLTLRIV